MADTSFNKVKYSAADFSTAFDDLRARLLTVFSDDFNDFTLSSIGVMLMDLVANATDSLSFYLDRRASDLYLATVRTRRSAVLLADQLDYKIGASVAASLDLHVALSTPYAFSNTIPKGFQFKGPNELVFETQQTVTFDAGYGPSNIKAIPCYQGVSIAESFVSDGTANQIFKLSRVPADSYIVQGSLQVQVGAGYWSESVFLTVDKTNQFEVSYGSSPAQISFGDGVVGNIPDTGSVITVRYIASRGKAGLIAANYIGWTAVVPLVTNFTPIALTISNPEGSVGGDDPEDLDRVRKLAGKVFNTRKSAITTSDYQALASAFADPLYGRVAVAQAISSRSVADDAVLLSAVQAISNLITPVKLAVNNLTSNTSGNARYKLNTILGALAALQTALDAAAVLSTQTDALQTTVLNNSRTAKNSVAEINNDAQNVIVEATTAAMTVSNLSNAFPCLITGSGTTSDSVLYLAKHAGARGALVSIAHTVGVTLGVAVLGNAITVSYNSNTASEVAAAVLADPVASTLVTPFALGNGSGLVGTVVATNLGFSSFSGIQDTSKAALVASFDKCKSEAQGIQTAAAILTTNLDNNIIANVALSKTKLALLGLDTSTAGSQLYAATQSRLTVSTEVGVQATPSGLWAVLASIDTAVLPLDASGSVALSVGEELVVIQNHVDQILSQDCSANLVSVPILTRNAAGFYAAPSVGLQQALQTYLTVRKDVTHTVQVTSGANYLRPVVLTVRVGVSSGYSLTVTAANVATSVDGVLRGRAFGASLYISELTNAILSTPGVGFANVTISGWLDSASVLQTQGLDSSGNLILASSQVISKGTVTIIPESAVLN